MPGRLCAILLNSTFTLCPTFALVSMNIRLFLRASSWPCASVTCRLSARSVLLPTRTMITSLPRSERTSSIQRRVCSNVLASVSRVSCVLRRIGRWRTCDVVDNHGNARVANVRRYERAEPLLTGRIPELEADGAVVEVHGLPCRLVFPGHADSYPTFDKKSIPIVAWYVLSKVSYMNLVIKDVLPTIPTRQY
jgi:hypothetical protein